MKSDPANLTAFVDEWTSRIDNSFPSPATRLTKLNSPEYSIGSKLPHTKAERVALHASHRQADWLLLPESVPNGRELSRR